MESPFLKHPGERYGDFVLTKHLPIAELDCTLRELHHLPSGAHVMHIGCSDPENLFCLSFKTFPSSGNGAAHILEHTVLCGSRKFPIKDPFFSMSRRSLNTFMNALTGADFTCYPAASQNEKDFYNLLDVYIDAVFHPQLKRTSFHQEGHRLEFASPADPRSPLEIKGIVFNEMKGTISSADTRMWHLITKYLMPDLPYAHNSGGEPEEIPNLTYAELVSFHETYYHPSRCLFFFYGNLPLKNHLDYIATNALKNVLPQSPIPPIKRQKRFTAPIYKEVSYPVGEEEDLSQRTIVSFAWLTAPVTDQDEVLALQVLDCVLMETDASLLKAALIRSELCAQTDAFMDAEMSEVPYVITCKGCDLNQADVLEQTIRKELATIAKQGIPSYMVDAAIHQLELARLEITGDHSPFGLTLFMRSALAKQHGCDPEHTLMIYSLFEKLLVRVKDPHYFPSLIKKHFLDNPHCLRLVMRPDPKLASQEIAEEKQKLAEIKAGLSEAQTLKIVEQAKELADYQKETLHQSIDCLPKVALADVTPITRDFALKHMRQGALDIYHHDAFTNHIVYADLICDLPAIADEDLPWVHLLTSLLPELGCGDRSYAQNLEYIQAHTGGIGLSCALHLQAAEPGLCKPSINLRGKALQRKMDRLLPLMRETLEKPRFDEKQRLEELIKQLRESQLNRLSRQAMRYATHLCVSGFSPACHVSESWYGLRYFKAIETLSKDLRGSSSWLRDKLLELASKLFSFHNPTLVLTCPKETLLELEKEGFYGLSSLQAKGPFTPWKVDYPAQSVISQARIIPSQVAFTAQAFPTVTYLHPYAPALTVAAPLFDNTVLHHKIREKGGAYGCGASYSSTLGYMHFHAYRDPHLASTLDTFHSAIRAIASGKFTEQDVEEAKLGIIQQFDAPISPGSRGIAAYAWMRGGKTQQMRQEFRERLLALDVRSIQHAVEAELLPKIEGGVTVCFAGKELLEKENALLKAAGGGLPVVPM